MKRDDLLLNWWRLHAPERVTWADIGAGDGEVTNQLAALRPKGTGFAWDIAPKSLRVRLMRSGCFPNVKPDYVLFNFVLHHVRDPDDVTGYLCAALAQCRLGVLIQEDLDDGTEETRELLRQHDARGNFLSSEQWCEKLSDLNPGGVLLELLHPEAADDTDGYHVPRALYVLTKPQEISDDQETQRSD